MNKLVVPLLVGFSMGIGVYVIIKASHNNIKVKKVITILGLSIAIILALILLFFLFNALV